MYEYSRWHCLSSSMYCAQYSRPPFEPLAWPRRCAVKLTSSPRPSTVVPQWRCRVRQRRKRHGVCCAHACPTAINRSCVRCGRRPLHISAHSASVGARGAPRHTAWIDGAVHSDLLASPSCSCRAPACPTVLYPTLAEGKPPCSCARSRGDASARSIAPSGIGKRCCVDARP